MPSRSRSHTGRNSSTPRSAQWSVYVDKTISRPEINGLQAHRTSALERDVLQIRSRDLIGWCGVQTPTGAVQMATLRTCDPCVRGPMVFAIGCVAKTSRAIESVHDLF